MFEATFEPIKEPRDFTTEERRAKFTASKQANYSGATPSSECRPIVWHPIDNPMSLRQHDLIPQGQPGIDSRTPLLWVMFPHPNSRKIVVSKGRFDHDGGTWAAQLRSEEDDGYCGRIGPSAWAHIIPGQIPWEGLVIT
jgi:hypothetical protein